jgi:pimeloyl-ACP methyl ester carboxylesterase
MKTIKLYILLFVALLVGCQQGEVLYVDFDTFHPTAIDEVPVFLEDGSMNPVIQMPESAPEDSTQPRQRIASTSINEVARNILGSIKSNDVVQIAGTYTGHDVNGEPLLLSGKLLLPKSGTVKRMILVCHYTIGANSEAPSETFPFEGILASKGYAVVVADYIGYGITRGMVHPYLHTESTAQSVVDMGLAVLPYLDYIGRAPEFKEIIVFGYSQGGAAALATMRMLEKEYRKQLPLSHVYAGAGPYDMAQTFDFSIKEDKTGIPCAAPMIVQGMNVGERLNLNMEKFFVPYMWKYCQDWINSKEHTVAEINHLIGTDKVSEILSEYARNKSNIETARLYKALGRNSVLDFKPEAPLFLLHSKDDQTVPFINSELAERSFKGCNVQYDFGHYGAHVQGFLRFLQTVSSQLDKIDD